MRNDFTAARSSLILILWYLALVCWALFFQIGVAFEVLTAECISSKGHLELIEFN